MIERRKKLVTDMKQILIIDGNAVYEIDEECMLRKKLEEQGKENAGNGYNRGEGSFGDGRDGGSVRVRYGYK